MKKLFSLALAVLLCLGCLVPAFAADVRAPAAATEAPSDATQEQPQQETAPDAEQPALPEAYLKWAHGGQYDDRGAFDRAFRQYYAADPDVTIIDHMVYVKSTMWSGWNKKVDCYRLIDFFDSDAAEAAATELCVPAEAGGLPVTMLAYNMTNPALTDTDQAFSNNTVQKVTIEEGFTSVVSLVSSFWMVMCEERLARYQGRAPRTARVRSTLLPCSVSPGTSMVTVTPCSPMYSVESMERA